MIFLVSSFTSYLIAYKYIALFIIVFSGSFIVPLPLNEIILMVGAFASLGYFNVFKVIFISLFTNISADMLGYFLTHRHGDTIFKFLRIKKDDAFFKVKKYLENYAYGTIFFCKIVGPFGPSVNFISGLIRIPFWKFLLFDVLGNITDVVFFVLAGYLVGKYWPKFLADLWIFAIIAIIIFLAYLIYKTRFRKIK